MTTRVGFIGLGRMGLPMCYQLLQAGFDLTVHNRSQDKVKRISQDGAWRPNPLRKSPNTPRFYWPACPTSPPWKRFSWVRAASSKTLGPGRSWLTTVP